MVDAGTADRQQSTETHWHDGRPDHRGGSQSGAAAQADRSLGSYAALSATFVAAFGGMLIVSRRRLPERFSGGDLALVALSTHKLSRTIARDRVTRPLRAPFTEVQSEDPPLELKERPIGQGLRRAIGELLSCPYCLDQWIAGAFIGGLVLAPRPTRATAGMFAAVTGSDYLQHLHRWVRGRA
ncbi:MAG: hypothetical protein JWL67_84 [Solirubrobacterales bacterium]|jgi:hypothetical protein|nr:hypothetical protein [Solirubrobacterales bacterium]